MRRRRQGIHFCVLGTRGSAGSRVRERTDEVEQRALGLAGEQNLGGNNIHGALTLELRLERACVEEADRLHAQELNLLAKRDDARKAGGVAAVAGTMRMGATFFLLSF